MLSALLNDWLIACKLCCTAASRGSWWLAGHLLHPTSNTNVYVVSLTRGSWSLLPPTTETLLADSRHEPLGATGWPASRHEPLDATVFCSFLKYNVVFHVFIPSKWSDNMTAYIIHYSFMTLTATTLPQLLPC